VNNIQSIITSEIYHPFLSDHKMTSCTVNIKKPKIKTISISSRNYAKICPENLSEFFQIIPVANDEAPESSLQALVDNTLKFFNLFAPTKNIKIKQRTHRKYLSEETIKLIHERDLAYSRSKLLTPEIKRFNALIKKAVILDTRKEFESKMKDSNLWCALKSLHLLAWQTLQYLMDSHLT